MITNYRKFISLLAAALAIGAASCSGGGSADETLPHSSATGDCVAEHMMPGHKALWTYLNCGPFEYAWINQETADTTTGEVVGKRAVNFGKITFRMTGLNNNKMDVNETFALLFTAQGRDDLEHSFRFTSKLLSSGNILSTLGMTRIGAGCTPGCDDKYENEDLQFRHENEVYQWDCIWEETKRRVACDITKPGDSSYRVSMHNIMYAPWTEFKYLGVGKNAFSGYNRNYDATVSNFRVTFFD